MAYIFKIYTTNEKEYFEYGQKQKTAKRSFAFPQSLMDMLYLDAWQNGDLFERMGKTLQSLYSSKDLKWAEEIKADLKTIAKQHIYFEFLRLDWTDRLEKAEKQEFKDILDLLPSKKLTHVPANLAAMQEQLLDLWREVLDILSPDKPIQKKLVEYYSAKERNSLNTFQFQPQPMNFEIVDKQTFTEVLYPKDIYDIIDFFVRQCIKQEVRFRVCKHCNRFFALTGHIGAEYCDRPFDKEGHTCKEIGAVRLWEKKREETPALKAYSKEYKRRFAWIKYGKIPKEAFCEWAEEARKKRDLCMKGEMPVEAFKAWLGE